MSVYVYIGIAILVLGVLAFFLAGRAEPAKATAGAGGKAPLPSAGERDSEVPRAVPSAPPMGSGLTSAPNVEVGSVSLDGTTDDTGPNPFILVTAVGRSDPGRKRKHNEDSYLVLDDHHLFVVADGMGRHAAGEVASRLAVDTVAAAFATNDFGKTEWDSKQSKEANRLRACFHVANDAVFQKSQEVEAYSGMGTTMVALHFSRNKERAAIAHAGDSRCYRMRDGQLVQLTKDHTLGAAGIVGPSANVLSKAVGIEEKLDPDLMTEKVQPDDLFLICSDGLSRMASHDEIQTILKSNRDLAKVSDELIDVANQAGGRDNVTVILVRVERAKIA